MGLTRCPKCLSYCFMDSESCPRCKSIFAPGEVREAAESREKAFNRSSHLLFVGALVVALTLFFIAYQVQA